MENIKNIEMVSLTEDELMELNGGVGWPDVIIYVADKVMTHDGPGIPIQRYRDYY